MKHPVQIFNYSIQNKASDAVDIHIDGDIVDASTQAIMKDWWGDDTSVSFKSFRNSVNETDAKTYNVYINSGGGHLGDAMAIHDLLIEMQTKGKTVNTIGRGIIASAATYILMAGSTSEMSKNSWFMIHNVSGGVYGDVSYIENYARTLRKFNDSARDFYSTATGMRKEDVTKMMDNETWMTANEAKDKGFVKNVSGDAAFTNSIKKEDWNYSNQSVLNAYNSAVKAPENNFLQTQFDDMKKFFTDIVNSIKGVKPAETDGKQEIVNAIADAMAAPLEKVGDEIEAAISNKVDEVIKGDVVKNAIALAVANAVKPLNDKIGEMEQEIRDSKGAASHQNFDKNAPKIIGQFNKN